MAYLEWAIWVAVLYLVVDDLEDLLGGPRLLIKRPSPAAKAEAKKGSVKVWGSQRAANIGAPIFEALMNLSVIGCLVLTAVTDFSKLHLLWLVFAAPSFVDYVVGRWFVCPIVRLFVGQAMGQRWEPKWSEIGIGFVCLALFGGLTWWQISLVDRGTAWVVFRLWMIPIPAIVLTALGSLAGMIVLVKGLAGQK